MHTRERVIFAILFFAGLTTTSVLISAHALGETLAQAVVTAWLLAPLISAAPAVLPVIAVQPRGLRLRRTQTGSRIRAGEAGKGFSTVSY